MLGHTEGLPTWVPKVDAFLSRIGLPAKPVYPGYMPTPFPPAHGEARILQGRGFPKFPPNNPRAVCNLLKVPGAAVAYTPETGFTGSDSLVFEEIDLDHRDLVFRMAVTVK